MGIARSVHGAAARPTRTGEERREGFRTEDAHESGRGSRGGGGVGGRAGRVSASDRNAFEKNRRTIAERRGTAREGTSGAHHREIWRPRVGRIREASFSHRV